MNIIYNGLETAPLFVFAHGAGAAMDSDFMVRVSTGLVMHNIRVARFNFNYMQQAIDSGKSRPPERATQLIKQFKTLLAKINTPCVIGGKSMGGRMASLLAAQLDTDKATNIKGVACLGYPFHPMGKLKKLRIDHFSDVGLPQLIIQGTRDPLGSESDVNGYSLPECIQWLWLDDGDHNLKPRIKSGFSYAQHLEKSIWHLANFIKYCFSNSPSAVVQD